MTLYLYISNYNMYIMQNVYSMYICVYVYSVSANGEYNKIHSPEEADRATPKATPTKSATREENGEVFVGEFSDEGDDIIGDLENEVMRTAAITPRARQ